MAMMDLKPVSRWLFLAAAVLCWSFLFSPGLRMAVLPGRVYNSMASADYTLFSTTSTGHVRRPIPSMVWQSFLSRKEMPEHIISDTESWQLLNPNHTYHLLEEREGLSLVSRVYTERPDLVSTYKSLASVALKADLLRYIVLALYGGVYSDTDTVAVKPVQDWIPQKYKGLAQVVVGIGYDQRDRPERESTMLNSLSMCQWTIMATPDHPLLQYTIDEVVFAIQQLADHHQTSLCDLRPTEKEMLATTGSAMWTNIVLKFLRRQGFVDLTLKSFSGIRQPLLLGDILILPIDAFGTGTHISQSHADSTHEGSLDVLVHRNLNMG